MSRAATYTMLFLGMAFFGSATPVSKLIVERLAVFVGGTLSSPIFCSVSRSIRCTWSGSDSWRVELH